MTTSHAAPDDVADGPGAGADIAGFRRRVDIFISKTDKLEERVNEVVRFFANKNRIGSQKGGSLKDKRRANSTAISGRNHKLGRRTEGKEVIHRTERMQELMSQFGAIMNHLVSFHDCWSWPFMEPVDVKGLGLDDYYEVIRKPMDFSTIRKQMKGKDSIGYNHVREIYADVRLIFTNAMTYNEERSDIHVMAKQLLEKFEERWLQLLPEVIEEETRQKKEQVRALENMQTAQETAIAKMARDTKNELSVINLNLEKLRERVVQNCRKLSVHEKRKLGEEISLLPPEDLDKALEIIAQDNPSFHHETNAIEIDMDAQSQASLWRLKIFVKRALENQSRSVPSRVKGYLKRKREMLDPLAKYAKK